jgi:hypothetical protein
MPFNPNMKPARARRTGSNHHWRWWRRRKTNFDLLHLNGNRLTRDNNAASHNKDTKKTNDI